MSSNKSKRQLRAIVLAASVTRHAEHEIILVCEPCGRRDSLPLAAYLSSMVGEVLGRLLCPNCRKQPSTATLTDQEGRRSMRLLGSGAFG